MFRHDYPYTDFHELNIDWLLKEWEKFLEEYQSTFTKVEELDQAVKDFKEYLENYFDNLDVQEEINNKLDEMEEDGSLETLLAHYVYITHNPDLVQVLNVAMNTHIYDVPSNPQPAFLQGYTCHNGVSYLAFMDPTGTTSDGIIRSYSNSTGQILNEARIQNAYHANSMCVHDGHLLLCSMNHTIISINPSSLAVEVTYPVTKDIRSLSSYNGVLYVTDDEYKLYAMTLPPDENYELKCNYQINNPSYSFIQSGCVYGDYFYAISSNPKIIAVININTGTIRNIINIEDYYYMYPTGEIEDIAIESGDEVFLASCTYGSYDQYRTGRVFNFSLNQNDSRRQTYAGGDYNPISALYVGDNTNGNPTGTISNPFPTMSQALQAMSSSIARSYQTNRIIMNKDCDEILYIRDMNLIITGKSHKIIRAVISACIAIIDDLAITANKVDGNFYAFQIAGSFFTLTNLTLDGVYSGTATAALQISDCVGTLTGLVSNSNIAKMYQSNVKSDLATIRQIVYQDRVSAERYIVNDNNKIVPGDRSIYSTLSFDFARGNNKFHCATKANQNNGTFHFVENYTFSATYTFIIHEISFAITNDVISFAVTSYTLTPSGTKAESSNNPSLLPNTIMYTP